MKIVWFALCAAVCFGLLVYADVWWQSIIPAIGFGGFVMGIVEEVRKKK